MGRHRHRWVKAPPFWYCTFRYCSGRAVLACHGENNDCGGGRCKRHKPKRQPKRRGKKR